MKKSLSKINKKLSLIAFLLLPYVILAQAQITGKVTSEKEIISFANVVLTDEENKIAGGAITDENGAFIVKVKKGNYKVTVSFIGYTNWTKNIVVEGDLSLGTIVLKDSEENLGEVVVEARKNLIVQKTDRLVFNVENNPGLSGGDALDALKVAPGLTIQNNTIGMIGKGAAGVMVDGRLLPITGDDLVNFLNSISADDIKSIEIITNPPAKYEAEGNSGLINIIYKKGARNSWKNSTTVAYNQNEFNFFTFRNNFSYNKNRFKLSMNLSGNTGFTRGIEQTDIFYPSGTWKTDIRGKSERKDYSGRIFVDYDITDNTTIGVQYLGNVNKSGTDDKANTQIFDTSDQLQTLLQNTGRSQPDDNNSLYNVHLVSKLDTLGRELSVDLDYFDLNSEFTRNFIAETYTPSNQFVSLDQSALNISNQNVDNYSIKVDFQHPLKAVNLSYGTKFSFIRNTSDVQFFNTITGTPVFDAALSNEFEYEENIQAVYVNASKKINDKLDVQVGLRAENTDTEGYSRTLNQTNTNSYFKLFPTVYISYRKNDNHQFVLNYGRRISRPSFRDLNPFRFYVNSNNFSEGNPFLQPSFSDNYDFTYTYKSNLRTNLFLNRTTNGFGTIFTPIADITTQIVTRQNYFEDYNFGLGESYSIKGVSWLQNNNSVYLLGSKTEFYGDVISAEEMNGFRFYVSTNNTISFSKASKFQVNFWYSTSYKTNLFDFGEMYNLSFGYKHDFLDKALQFSLFLNDVFDTGSLNNLVSNVNNIKQNYTQNYSNRYLRLSLTYSFGNKKINVNQRGFGNDEERRRAGAN